MLLTPASLAGVMDGEEICAPAFSQFHKTRFRLFMEKVVDNSFFIYIIETSLGEGVSAYETSFVIIVEILTCEYNKKSQGNIDIVGFPLIDNITLTC